MSEKSPRSRVQLFIKCLGLIDVEVFSKSDPFVEVYEKKNEHLSYIDKTEVIWDDLNPKFSKSIEIDYYFEIEKVLIFKIFDANLEEEREVKGDFLGETEYTLGQIVGTKGNWLKKSLYNEKKRPTKGYIFVRAVEVDEGNFDLLTVTFEGNSLKHKGLCCLQVFRPLFTVCRVMERGENQTVYSSEVLRGNNPIWKPIKKVVRELNSGDMNTNLLFILSDFRRSGKPKKLGSFQFTLSELKEGGKKSFRVLDDYKNDIGEIRVNNLSFTKQPTFLDYIYGGCTINLIIGIDFTSSNGHPSGPSSMHYISSQKLNPYQQALQAVGQILLNYDSDKLVPIYGFGAEIEKVVNHCFPLNFNTENPSVYGLNGIMDCYKEAMQKIKLSGPTNFAPLIKIAVENAEEAHVDQSNQQYYILLILTDGLIADMKETIDTIVRGTGFPLSIIIVGLGHSDFGNMDILDGDDAPLKDSNGNFALRDIVQFVPYENYKQNPSLLAEEVLAEIPREIINYFSIKQIQPNSRLNTYNEVAFSEPPINLNDINPIILGTKKVVN